MKYALIMKDMYIYIYYICRCMSATSGKASLDEELYDWLVLCTASISSYYDHLQYCMSQYIAHLQEIWPHKAQLFLRRYFFAQQHTIPLVWSTLTGGHAQQQLGIISFERSKIHTGHNMGGAEAKVPSLANLLSSGMWAAESLHLLQRLSIAFSDALTGLSQGSLEVDERTAWHHAPLIWDHVDFPIPIIQY